MRRPLWAIGITFEQAAFDRRHPEGRLTLGAGYPLAGSLRNLPVISELEWAAQSRFLNSRNVHEDVFAAVVRLDKSVTLGRVEPFHYTCRHVRFSNLKTTAVS